MKLVYRIIVLAAVFFSVPSVSFAVGPYYVSPSGAGDCSSASPCSVATGMSSAPAGSTIIFTAGNYPRTSITKSGLSGSSITYQVQGTVVTKGFNISGSYITIDGFEIANTNPVDWDYATGAGVYITGLNNLIKNNYIHDVSLVGVYDSGNSNTILNNRIYHVGFVGVEVHGSNDLIEGNEVWGTIQCHPGAPSNCSASNNYDADGMHFFGTGHVFRKNYIHDIIVGAAGNPDPHTDCFQTWGPATNITFERNHCDNPNGNGKCGWTMEALQGSVNNIAIKNNIIKAPTGIDARSPVSSVNLYNNLWTTDPNASDWRVAIYFSGINGSRIQNNIFYNFNASKGQELFYYQTSSATISNNIAYNNIGSTPACSGYCTVSNPLFLSASDFHLQTGSPAIDAGVSVPVIDDYDGNPRPQGAGYDIGAFESGSGGVVTTLVPTATPRPPTPTPTPTTKPTPTTTIKPTNTPIPNLTQTPTSTPIPGQTFSINTRIEAEAGVITAPFSVSSGIVSQSVSADTDPMIGGKAQYRINIPAASDYQVNAVVNALDESKNSLYVNFDSNPTDPTMIWDILPFTGGPETRTVSWRGNGTYDANELNPKIFNLTAGVHTLYIVGRESSVGIDALTVVPSIVEGDTNGDGKVDGVDYMIWLNNYNLRTTLGPKAGDLNSDGISDGVDYTIWLSNYK